MNYLFKAAAGVMSALVLAAGSGLSTNVNRACPQVSSEACTAPILCESGVECSSADIQKLIGECESTSDMLRVLMENGLCSKDDLQCIIDGGSCTADDVCKVLENCNTDRSDIVSAIENACAEQKESSSENCIDNCNDNYNENDKESCKQNCDQIAAADCNGTDCESEASCAPSCDKQQLPSINSNIDVVLEQINENRRDDSDKNCTTGCDNASADTKCQDSDCSEASAEPVCGEGDCRSEAAKGIGTVTNGIQKNAYNINDLLKAFGITITADTGCNSDSGCDKNTAQTDETQNENETAADTENAANGIPETFYEVSDYEAEVVRLVNEIRADYGLGELTLNEELSAVARLKSEDMRDKHYFSHNSPTYGSPFEMMKRFGISYRTAGENIAMGQRTPQEVVNGWMNSEGHRANILNASFTEIGVGYAENGHYWTQMFIG